MQAYALQRVIQENIAPCEQISYRLSGTPLKKKIENAMTYGSFWDNIQKIFREQILGKLCNALLRKTYQKKTAERIEAFERFEQVIPHSKRIYDYENIRESIEDYDTYIVGSDQIWTGGVDLGTYLLTFAENDKKKIAYAASSNGILYRRWQKKMLRESLPGFDAISVRENSLKRQLIEIADCAVENVFDPVFLLSEEEWKQVIKKPKITEEYILCYFLGTDVRQRQTAEEISRRMGYRMLVFPYITGERFRMCDWNYGDIRDYTSGPAEFLGLLYNAQAVITDSFHAAAFSIIFQKRFCVFPRYQNARKSLSNSRLVDLLSEFGIKDRIAEKRERALEILMQPIDYTRIKTILEMRKGESLHWLKDAVFQNIMKEDMNQ